MDSLEISRHRRCRLADAQRLAGGSCRTLPRACRGESGGAAHAGHGPCRAGCCGRQQSLAAPQIHARHHGPVDPAPDRADDRRIRCRGRRAVPCRLQLLLPSGCRCRRSPRRCSSRLQLGNEADPRRAAILAAADAFRDLDDDARIATGKPCPLLIDHRCSVYNVRPINCRSFTSPDATNCHESMRRIEAGESPLPIEVYVVLRFLCGGEQAAVRGICRDLGLQSDIVELTQTVAAIIRDPDRSSSAGPRARRSSPHVPSTSPRRSRSAPAPAPLSPSRASSPRLSRDRSRGRRYRGRDR